MLSHELCISKGVHKLLCTGVEDKQKTCVMLRRALSKIITSSCCLNSITTALKIITLTFEIWYYLHHYDNNDDEDEQEDHQGNNSQCYGGCHGEANAIVLWCCTGDGEVCCSGTCNTTNLPLYSLVTSYIMLTQVIYKIHY